MNIQSNNNINFQAKHILNARQVVESGADKVIDIFLLGKEDKKFVQRCADKLELSGRQISPNRKNIKNSAESSDKHFKKFFNSFLNHVSGKNSDGLAFDNFKYLVAVKNGEIISGVAELSDRFYPNMCVERLIFPQKDEVAEDSLLYSVLNQLKHSLKDRSKSSYILGIGSNTFKHPGEFGMLFSNDITRSSWELKNKHRDTIFKTLRNGGDYDLEEFLGIKDFETERLK